MLEVRIVITMERNTIGYYTSKFWEVYSKIKAFKEILSHSHIFSRKRFALLRYRRLALLFDPLYFLYSKSAELKFILPLFGVDKTSIS